MPIAMLIIQNRIETLTSTIKWKYFPLLSQEIRKIWQFVFHISFQTQNTVKTKSVTQPRVVLPASCFAVKLSFILLKIVFTFVFVCFSVPKIRGIQCCNLVPEIGIFPVTHSFVYWVQIPSSEIKTSQLHTLYSKD